MSSAASTSTSVASGSASASVASASEGATPDSREQLSGRWGKQECSSVQLYGMVININDGDWLGILCDEATLSGQPNSRFTGYLYAKQLIIRQRIVNAAENEEERHMVYCCHCKHKWGPYPPSYTTTTAFGKHFRSLHSQLPSREEVYKSVIKRMADATTTGKRKRTGATPFTIATQLAGTRQPGELFDEQEYRRLLAMMVVETNTAFRAVEVVSFQNLMHYCNAQVPIVSHSMLYRDIYKLLYRRLFKEVCQ